MAPRWKIAITIGRFLDLFVWARAVRQRNDGVAAKLASATPLDLMKNLRLIIPYLFWNSGDPKTNAMAFASGGSPDERT